MTRSDWYLPLASLVVEIECTFEMGTGQNISLPDSLISISESSRQFNDVSCAILKFMPCCLGNEDALHTASIMWAVVFCRVNVDFSKYMVKRQAKATSIHVFTLHLEAIMKFCKHFGNVYSLVYLGTLVSSSPG